MYTTQELYLSDLCSNKRVQKSFVLGKRYHTGEIPLVPCHKCNKEFASNESLRAHNIIHLGLELLKKANRNRLRMEQNLVAKKFAKGKPGKSVPAKHIPSKSPRAKPRKTSTLKTFVNYVKWCWHKGFLQSSIVVSATKFVLSNVLLITFFASLMTIP